jgi:PAS domain S-box-containing protein
MPDRFDPAAKELLWEEGGFVLMRGHSTGAQPTLFLTSSSVPSLPRQVARLERAYELRAELDVGWALRPWRLTFENSRATLHHDDPGGDVLARHVGTRWETAPFLKLAVGLTRALRRLHERRIVHGDLRPSHVLTNLETGEAWLFGFGVADLDRRLPYTAPEQPGDSTRPADARSDLYSLGAIFYELLSGRPPVNARPLAPEGPEQLAAIVMKLLEQAAEDRYQTAAGLEGDLRLCASEWQARKRIDVRPLGDRASTNRLVIADRLYGRSEASEQLRASLERVERGPSELTLISGYSGSGKSSLVDDFQRVLARRGALLARGKFDAYKRDIPYATIAEALQDLIEAILRESETVIATWRSGMQEALGASGALLLGLVPALELIVGPQPPVPEVSVDEAKHRFQLLLQRFFSVLARPEHPLVLFLDDLQWADRASLEVLRYLLETGLQHLLLLGAYRDGEVLPSHPLRGVLDALRTSGAAIRTIVLGSLPITDVHQLLADAFEHAPPRLADLSRLVHDKTEGNPFFVIQFVRALHDDGLLTFDERSRSWTWDTDRIVAHGFDDDLPAFMASRIGRLPHAAREAMKRLACAGRATAVALLSSVLDATERELHESLREAVVAGLLIRTETGYAFPHDSVQEASYASIEDSERAAIHLRLGQLLEAASRALRDDTARRHASIFEAAHHLNRAASLVTSREQREQVARLDLLAADQAMASVAFASAASYLAAGSAILPADAWQTTPDLAFAIALRWANCRYLTGELAAADAQLAELARRPASRADQCAVTCLRATVYLTLNLPERATQVCLEQLRSFGIDWELRPSVETVRAEYERLQRRLPDGSPEGLVKLPLMADGAWRACMDVLNAMQGASVHHDMDLHDLCALHMANMSIEHGHCDTSILGLAELPMVLSRLGNRELGFQFGQASLQLLERPELRRFACRIFVWVGYHISPWTDPLRTSQTLVRRALALALESGDQTFRMYSLVHAVSLALATGDPLDGVQRDAEAALAVARKAGFELVVQVLLGQLALIEALRGGAPSAVADVGLLEDPGGLVIAACFYWIRQVQVAVLFGDTEAALRALARAAPLAPAANTFFEEAEYEYYGALALAACGDRAGAARHYARLTGFANAGPETFGFRMTIVAAELARLDGQLLDAERLFELALGKARAAGLVHEEALTYEVAARFYEAGGLPTIARAFRASARSCYERWGAFGKARDLDRKHPEDASPSGAPLPARQLDLSTVLEMSKAVSSEIELDRLVERVVVIAVEQARARRGLLITMGEDGARVEAEALAKSSKLEVRLVQAPVSGATLPTSIVEYVARTQQIVNLDDGMRPNPFSSDAYLARSRARSVLCIPLVRQTKIVAVLYLENDDTSHAFTPDRIAILHVLAAQAAISLENARLYSELQRSDLYLAEAQRLTNTGSYGWPVDGGTITWSDEARRIYGFEPGTKQTTVDVHRLMDPEDRRSSERQVEVVSAVSQDWVDEFWITTAAGQRKRVRVIGHAVERASGFEYIGSVMDVTAARQAEAELRRAHLYLDRAQRLSRTGSFGWGIESGHVFWSDEAFAIYGYDRGVQPTPALVLERVHPDDKARIVDQVQQVVAVDSDWNSEFRLVMPDGEVKHVHVAATSVRDESGKREYIGAVMDVTAAKRAEDELWSTRRQHALTLSSIGDGVIATDEQARVTFMNPVAEALTGWSQSGALGRPLDQVYRVISGDGHPVLVSESGRQVPIDERRSPIVDDGGVPNGSVLVFRDDTQRRMAEETTALQLANERLQLALRGSNVGIFDFDLREARIDEAPVYTINFWDALGYAQDGAGDALPSRRVHPERWHPEDRGRIRDALDAHLSGRTPLYEVVGRLLHRDGSPRWYIHRGKAIRNASGRATRLVGSIVDITDRKELEEQLVRAKELAETANQAKDDFLANVSHEIRTPMNAVLGMIEMALGEPLTVKQRQWLGNAKLAADSLLAIIDELLDFAKLEAGKLELAASEFSLDAVLEETLRTLAIRAHLKGLKLSAHVAAGVPDRLLLGDAGRLRQILLNLVGNAVKFTAKGEVEVVVALGDPGGELDVVPLRFSVRDTGIGIPPEKQALIFQAFTQQDTSTTRTYGGTGLGLTIASRLASLMSGTISVSSQPGQGSTFTFAAPFGVSSKPGPIRTGGLSLDGGLSLVPSPTTTDEAAHEPRLRVLVAEDNEFNADLIQQLLQRRGHEVRIAANGTDAMALASAAAFDLLLLDLHMPGMDGFAVIARLRAEERDTGRHLPVIALTARARSEDRARCLAAGMDEFLAKPVRPQALWSAIARVTRVPA